MIKSRQRPIREFQDENRFLSNFFPAFCHFEGIDFPSVEHAFQAAKSLSPAKRQAMAKLKSPADAKRAGRLVALRSDWEVIKHEVMLVCVQSKFLSNPNLRAKLLATGNRMLIEDNEWHDNIWGICRCRRCKNGQNLLGQILMSVRNQLRLRSL